MNVTRGIFGKTVIHENGGVTITQIDVFIKQLR
jgi:hypothetical protein